MLRASPTFFSSALLVTLLLAAAGCSSGTAPTDAAPPATDAARCTANAVCDDGVFCNGAELCAPASAAADARGCVPSPHPCLAGQLCEEGRARCRTDCDATGDADGDGAGAAECGGSDCDDADPLRFPGAIEVCDVADRDEDCDPSTFGTRDADGDGVVSALCCNDEGDRRCGADCDDSRSSARPLATEVCNELDDDCDGAIDEGVERVFHPDLDGDGYGDPGGAPVRSCRPPTGTAENALDCDDSVGSVNPAAYDRCDSGMVDDDCSGSPNDPPGGCACTTGDTRDCPQPGSCAAGTQTCVADVWADCSVQPVAEVCDDAIDQDCDGAADDGCACSGVARLCGIERGECARGLQICGPDGTWLGCADAIGPTPEVCDGRDEDCDGRVDDGVATSCWYDGDGDGFAASGATVTEGCSARCAVGTTDVDPSTAADCDDTDTRAFPGQTSYFATAHAGTPAFDHSCDGLEEIRQETVSCVDDGAGGCDVTSVSGIAPGSACGATVPLFDCLPAAGSCAPTMTGGSTAVECR